MRGGPIEVDKLVGHVLKNPKNYDTLRARVGDEFLDAPGGFKDLVLERIVSSGFPTGSVTSDVVQSGSFGQSWMKTMKEMNKNGALNKILGDEAVSDLMKISKAGQDISDSVMKGKTGLAAAGYAAAFGSSLILNPIATLGGAASILALSRALRSKPIMKYLSSPRLRAYEAEKAIQMGAELGPRNLAYEKASESAFRSLRTILVDAGYYATSQGANVVRQEVIDPSLAQLNQEVQQIQQPATQPQMQSQQPTVDQRDTSILRKVEENKLLGVTPTQ